MTREQMRASRELAAKLMNWGNSRLRKLMAPQSVHDWAAVMANAFILCAVVTMKGTGAAREHARELLDLHWQSNNVETVVQDTRTKGEPS